MAIQNAAKGGLEDASNTPDAIKLAKKADPFIRKEAISNPSNLVIIPTEAKVFKQKGGDLLFFRNQPGPNNHLVEIPPGATHVQYPQYSAHRDHINYGDPVFHYQ